MRVAKQAVRQPLNLPMPERPTGGRDLIVAESGHAVAGHNALAQKTRQIHKVGEVNISAYFPAEVKASLRMVQAKTGYNLKGCLAEALSDLFRKHNVPVSVELGESR